MAKQRQVDTSQGLRYVGNGSWIVGVPARDLTPDEAEKYADAIAAQAASGEPIYAAIAADPQPVQAAAGDQKKD